METDHEISSGVRSGDSPSADAGHISRARQSAAHPADRSSETGATAGPRRLRKGTELRLRAERLDERGSGVAQPASCALSVHVADLLPGETARVVVRHVSGQGGQTGRSSPGRAFAEVLRREDAAPQRVTPACAGYGRCGGCTLQHLEDAAQLRWKTQQLAQQLRQTLGAVVAAPTESEPIGGQLGSQVESQLGSQVAPAGTGPQPEAASGSVEPSRSGGSPGVRVAPCVASPSSLYYRSRVKLVVSPGPPLTLGSYAPRSHRVVDMAGCRVNARALTAVARTLTGLWSRAGLPVFLDGPDAHDGPDGDGGPGRSGLRYVLLREVRSGAIQLSLVLGEALPAARLQPILDGLRAAHPRIESVVLHLNPSRSNTLLPLAEPSPSAGPEPSLRPREAAPPATDAAPPAEDGGSDAREAEDSLGRSDADRSLLGPMFLWEELGGDAPLDAAAPADSPESAQARKMIQEPLRLRVSARSFLQVNRGLAARLYCDVARALELRPGEAILDLYCGVSGLGRTVLRTQPVSHLIGIEWSHSAIADALASAAADGLSDRTRFFCGGVAEQLPEALTEVARRAPGFVTLLNPPRRGCEPQVLRTLLEAAVRPRAIAYVSCSPSSLARDLSVLLPAGYRLLTVTPYDMHPGTPHIETVAILERVPEHAAR